MQGFRHQDQHEAIHESRTVSINHELYTSARNGGKDRHESRHIYTIVCSLHMCIYGSNKLTWMQYIWITNSIPQPHRNGAQRLTRVTAHVHDGVYSTYVYLRFWRSDLNSKSSSEIGLTRVTVHILDRVWCTCRCRYGVHVCVGVVYV